LVRSSFRRNAEFHLVFLADIQTFLVQTSPILAKSGIRYGNLGFIETTALAHSHEHNPNTVSSQTFFKAFVIHKCVSSGSFDTAGFDGIRTVAVNSRKGSDFRFSFDNRSYQKHSQDYVHKRIHLVLICFLQVVMTLFRYFYLSQRFKNLNVGTK